MRKEKCTVGDLAVTFTITLQGFSKTAADKYDSAELINDIRTALYDRWSYDDIVENVGSREFIGEDDSRFIVLPFGIGYEYVVRDTEKGETFAGPTNSFDAHAVAKLMNERNEGL